MAISTIYTRPKFKISKKKQINWIPSLLSPPRGAYCIWGIQAQLQIAVEYPSFLPGGAAASPDPPFKSAYGLQDSLTGLIEWQPGFLWVYLFDWVTARISLILLVWLSGSQDFFEFTCLIEVQGGVQGYLNWLRSNNMQS